MAVYAKTLIPVSSPPPNGLVTFTPSPTITITSSQVPTITLTTNPSPALTPLPIQTEVAQLRNDITRLQQDIESVKNSQNSVEVFEMKQQLSEIDSRLANIENVILDDPSKALSLVIVQKDVEDIKQQQNSDVQSLREEINRVYGLSQWFIGLMITMAISVFGLSVRNYLNEREKSKTETESKK